MDQVGPALLPQALVLARPVKDTELGNPNRRPEAVGAEGTEEGPKSFWVTITCLVLCLHH